VLLDNPLARLPHYRLWVIWRCKALRFLDFKRVTLAERERAVEVLGEDAEHMTEVARGIAGKKSAAALAGGGAAGREENGIGGGSGGRVKLNAKERKKIEEMIRKAKTLGEIERLEKELAEGKVPGGVLVDDDDSEDEDEDEDMED
jgi:U2 small nuclear ribonucleoprotein A'